MRNGSDAKRNGSKWLQSNLSVSLKKGNKSRRTKIPDHSREGHYGESLDGNRHLIGSKIGPDREDQRTF